MMEEMRPLLTTIADKLAVLDPKSLREILHHLIHVRDTLSFLTGRQNTTDRSVQQLQDCHKRLDQTLADVRRELDDLGTKLEDHSDDDDVRG